MHSLTKSLQLLDEVGANLYAGSCLVLGVGYLLNLLIGHKDT